MSAMAELSELHANRRGELRNRAAHWRANNNDRMAKILEEIK